MVGLISDTHGLLREEAARALRGAELIIHAGDVGKAAILDALRRLAPVVVVRGNIDSDAWCKALPPTAVAEIDGKTVYVIHNIQELDLDPAAAGFHVVVSGHTHKPACYEKSGVLYVNPGSAGPRRFNLPIGVAHLDLSCEPPKVEFIELEERGPR
ncbi:MAG TPA: metallophosphoesterase family protein [Candidatus Baltobacteraceae bacterium]|nr:metallophosphoesterase family protein [Candidatus Baltobacteraceae bacterium]